MILNLLIAFSGGFVSFLSPCVLPLIPGYISYISGQTLDEIIEDKKLVLLKTIFFSVGFSIVFVSFGITASFIGKFLINYSNQLRIIAGLIIILFSLQLIGLINLKILNSANPKITHTTLQIFRLDTPYTAGPRIFYNE